MAERNYSELWTTVSYEKETIGYAQVCERTGFTAIHPRPIPWQCVYCGNLFQSHVDYGTIPKCSVCYPKTVSKGEIELATFVRSLGMNIQTNAMILPNY